MKRCKKCGKELHESTTRCFNCGKDQRSCLKRYFVFFILFIIIILIAFFSGKNETQNDLTEADLLESSTANAEIKESYNLGELFINGSIDIKYISAQEDFKKHSQYANVKSQYDVVKAEFEFRNVSKIDRLITSNEFSCYADGEECERFYSVDESSFSSTLLAGKKITKSVYFQVPVKSKEIKIRYETTFGKEGYIEFVVK